MLRARRGPCMCFSTKSETSRARSPISATITISASAPWAIMSSSTDLPTPEPAITPMRWPTPKVVSALSARTPTSKGSRTGARSSAPPRTPPAGQSWRAAMGGPPSIGRPSPSTARPRKASPTGSMPGLPSGRTRAPGRSNTVSPSSIISMRPPRKPMVSAIREPAPSLLGPWVMRHCAPMGSDRPLTSSRPPSQAVTRPYRRGANSGWASSHRARSSDVLPSM
jgi:hypothetical protein